MRRHFTRHARSVGTCCFKAGVPLKSLAYEILYTTRPSCFLTAESAALSAHNAYLRCRTDGFLEKLTSSPAPVKRESQAICDSFAFSPPLVHRCELRSPTL